MLFIVLAGFLEQTGILPLLVVALMAYYLLNHFKKYIYLSYDRDEIAMRKALKSVALSFTEVVKIKVPNSQARGRSLKLVDKNGRIHSLPHPKEYWLIDFLNYLKFKNVEIFIDPDSRVALENGIYVLKDDYSRSNTDSERKIVVKQWMNEDA